MGMVAAAMARELICLPACRVLECGFLDLTVFLESSFNSFCRSVFISHSLIRFTLFRFILALSMPLRTKPFWFVSSFHIHTHTLISYRTMCSSRYICVYFTRSFDCCCWCDGGGDCYGFYDWRAKWWATLESQCAFTICHWYLHWFFVSNTNNNNNNHINCLLLLATKLENGCKMIKESNIQ